MIAAKEEAKGVGLPLAVACQRNRYCLLEILETSNKLWTRTQYWKPSCEHLHIVEDVDFKAGKQ